MQKRSSHLPVSTWVSCWTRGSKTVDNAELVWTVTCLLSWSSGQYKQLQQLRVNKLYRKNTHTHIRHQGEERLMSQLIQRQCLTIERTCLSNILNLLSNSLEGNACMPRCACVSLVRCSTRRPKHEPYSNWSRMVEANHRGIRWLVCMLLTRGNQIAIVSNRMEGAAHCRACLDHRYQTACVDFLNKTSLLKLHNVIVQK